METKVLEQSEIQKIKELQAKRDQLMSDFGFIEMRIQELELQKESLIEFLNQLKQEETQIGQEISNKYGKGSVDLNNGEFTIID